MTESNLLIGVGMAIGGIELTVLFTVIATGFAVLAIGVMVAMALAPHLSTGWAEGYGGAVSELDDVSEPDEVEGAA